MKNLFKKTLTGWQEHPSFVCVKFLIWTTLNQRLTKLLVWLFSFNSSRTNIWANPIFTHFIFVSNWSYLSFFLAFLGDRRGTVLTAVGCAVKRKRKFFPHKIFWTKFYFSSFKWIYLCCCCFLCLGHQRHAENWVQSIKIVVKQNGFVV